MAAVVGYSRGRTGRGAQGHGSGGRPSRPECEGREDRVRLARRSPGPLHYTTVGIQDCLTLSIWLQEATILSRGSCCGGFSGGFSGAATGPLSD